MFQSQLKSQELRKAFERLDVDQSGATSGQFSQVNHGTKCAMVHIYVTGGYMELSMDSMIIYIYKYHISYIYLYACFSHWTLIISNLCMYSIICDSLELYFPIW